MDVDSTYKNLEHIIEISLEGKPISLDDLRVSISQISSCILVSYDNSRDLVQRTMSLLEKCPEQVISVLLYEVNVFIDNIHAYFSPDVENISEIYHRSRYAWSEEDIKQICEKVMPLFGDKLIISQYNENIAKVLSPEERMQFISFAIDCVQRYGLQTTWSKEIIDLHYSYFSILYSICKHDSIMRLCVHFAENFIDRMPLSANPQLVRDFAESILMIGYTENMEADAYLSAARAYALCHQTIAGLFYLRVAMMAINNTSRRLAKDEIFEILWLMLKILRELPGCPVEITTALIKKFKDFRFEEHQVVYFMHSAFYLKLKGKQKQVVAEVLDFLNEYREPIMQNMEHSSAPWLTLLSEIERYYPGLFNDQLRMYKNIFNTYLEKTGNERLVDILKGEKLAQHLFESIRQLEKTRNSGDLTSDNKSALLIANRLLPQAVQQGNVGDFVLSMRVKTDFTFIFKDKYQNEMYRKLELEDIPGDYDTPYRHRKTLPNVLALVKHDGMLWIGESGEIFYYMSLRDNEYAINELKSLDGIEVEKINKIVSSLQYIPDLKDESGYYRKSEQDFEAEDAELIEKIGRIIIPEIEESRRLFIVKDVSISSIPHHLFSNSKEKLIGNVKPTANVISTEFLIQSNFYNNIESNIQPNFWMPLDSEDFALNQLWSHLEGSISNYDTNILTKTTIARPMDSAINIVCAHGAKNIGEAEWFYANGKPIKNVDDIIGEGKLLILLVCHAGMMQSGKYDTAVHSIVKRFIKKGYCSVVAPAWSLSTEIVPLWMSIFMEDFLNKKEYVVDAVFNANMAVKDAYTAISSWACMHLYGNPYLQVNEKPSLSMIEK